MPSRRVFVSYAKDDATKAREAVAVIRSLGHEVTWQSDSFLGGGNFVAEIHSALASCDAMIALLSPSYLDSDWCTAEWTAAFARDPAALMGYLIPIRIETCQPQGLLGPRTYIDVSRLNTAQRRKRLRRDLVRVFAKATAAPPEPGVTNLPDVRQALLGRDEEIDLIGRSLGQRRSVVITGLSGIGKSAVALEVAQASSAKVRWWLDAGALIPSQLTRLAEALGLEGAWSLEAWLLEHDDWLIVIDGIRSAAELRDLPIPPDRNLLLTSELPNWKSDLIEVPLQPLDESSSVRLLADRIEIEPTTAAELCGYLGGLPIALRLAAGYLRSTGTPAAELLSRFHTAAADAAAAILSLDVGDTDLIWHLPLEDVRTTTPDAWRVLAVLAFFAPQPIPRAVLGSQAPGESLAPILHGREPLWILLDRALAALRNRSLVEFDAAGLVRVHPLVQVAVRQALTGEEPGMAAVLACSMIYRVLPAAPHATDEPIFRLLGPHAIVAAHLADELAPESVDPPIVLRRVGSFLAAIHADAQALQLLRDAKALADRREAIDMTFRPQLLSALALAEGAAGDLGEALYTSSEALRLWAGVYGESVGYAHELSNQGMLRHKAGDLAEARKCLTRAEDLHRALGSLWHAAIDQSNLAIIEMTEGRLDRAESRLRQALAQHLQLGGAATLEVATDRVNLAEVLRAGGGDSEVIELLDTALSTINRVFGPSHPRTLEVEAFLAERRRAGETGG